MHLQGGTYIRQKYNFFYTRAADNEKISKFVLDVLGLDMMSYTGVHSIVLPGCVRG